MLKIRTSHLLISWDNFQMLLPLSSWSTRSVSFWRAVFNSSVTVEDQSQYILYFSNWRMSSNTSMLWYGQAELSDKENYGTGLHSRVDNKLGCLMESELRDLSLSPHQIAALCSWQVTNLSYSTSLYLKSIDGYRNCWGRGEDLP